MIIISLSGRKQSGKTLLAKVAEQHGFLRKSWASPLKTLIGKLLNVSQEFLAENKNKELNLSFDEVIVETLANETGLNIDELRGLCLGKTVKTIRDLLQFLGTDVIRSLDQDWHIKKLANELKDQENYVFDDTRFPNEKAFLDKRKAICFFILRPRNYEYDHHESEVSLRWNDFSDYIVNNTKNSLSLEKRFGVFCHSIKSPMIKSSPFFNDFKDKLELRSYIKDYLNSKGGIDFLCEKYKVDRCTIFLWKSRLFLYFDAGIYKINPTAFSKPTLESSYLAGLLCADGCIKDNASTNSVTISLDLMDEVLVRKFATFLETDKPIQSKEHSISKKMIYCFATGNPFLLENIKLWNIKPRKSEKEEFPWIIKNDLPNTKAWIVGLIDGDGSICFGYQNNKKWPNLKPSLRLQILASKGICDFLTSIVPIHHTVRPHKQTQLMEMSFLNFYALDFFNWLEKPDYGLERKWSKLEEWKNLNTSRRTPKNEYSD